MKCPFLVYVYNHPSSDYHISHVGLQEVEVTRYPETCKRSREFHQVSLLHQKTLAKTPCLVLVRDGVAKCYVSDRETESFQIVYNLSRFRHKTSATSPEYWFTNGEQENPVIVFPSIFYTYQSLRERYELDGLVPLPTVHAHFPAKLKFHSGQIQHFRTIWNDYIDRARLSDRFLINCNDAEQYYELSGDTEQYKVYHGLNRQMHYSPLTYGRVVYWEKRKNEERDSELKTDNASRKKFPVSPNLRTNSC